jgi:hypothetical protein
MKVRARQVAGIPPGALERVDHGGIALQSHADSQPVGVNGRHEGPLCRAAGFLLDDRRQRDELVDVQPSRLGLRAERRRQHFLEPFHHACDELRRGRAARQRVRIREQVAFEVARRRIEVMDEPGVGGRGDELRARAEALALEELAHLPDGETFSKRDRPQVDIPARDLRHDFPHRHRAIEPVLTSLQPPPAAGTRQLESETERIADDSRLRQPLPDRRGAGAWRNVDELLFRCVAFVRPAEAEIDPRSRTRDGQDDDDERPCEDTFHKSSTSRSVRRARARPSR